MRKCKLSSPTGNPFEVFSLLYPQDRKYKNNVSLFSLNGDNMTYLDKVHPADISDAIANITFYREMDYYITANTFARDCGRSQATLVTPFKLVCMTIWYYNVYYNLYNYYNVYYRLGGTI